jgi:hypothetical protein
MNTFMSGEHGIKWCPGCKNFLELERFTKDVGRPDQKQVYCKKCRSAQYKASKWSQVPEYTKHVTTEYPSRGCVPEAQRALFDEYHKAGVAVVVVTPSGREIDWGLLD